MDAEDNVGPQAYVVNTLHIEPFSEIEKNLSFYICLSVCLNMHLQEFMFTMCLQSIQKSEVTRCLEPRVADIREPSCACHGGCSLSLLTPILTALPHLSKPPTNFLHHRCLVLLYLCLDLTLTCYLFACPIFVVISCDMLTSKDK